ncbi:A24 family peptidase [Paenibacillus sp. YPG26]|uniref:A24 family peptidase n=1 Tax=Paenibacillus sp. YPG26 TaxID=2878915 RepID=UPI00203C9A38|nr:A24 family peptidase [Paenibacillus sp. YPG26]USB34113.1 A24 family peptidase [Paenibacillus sp. YPG26]
MDIGFVGCMIFLSAAFVTDIRYMKIPNKLTVPAMVAGVMYQLWAGGWVGLASGLKGAVIGFGIMLVLYWTRAVGGGDVKLFGGIGAWMGTGFTLSSLVYSIVFAGLLGLLILIWRREVIQRMRGVLNSVLGAIILKGLGPLKSNESDMLSFPFMLAVLPGVLTAYYYL